MSSIWSIIVLWRVRGWRNKTQLHWICLICWKKKQIFSQIVVSWWLMVIYHGRKLKKCLNTNPSYLCLIWYMTFTNLKCLAIFCGMSLKKVNYLLARTLLRSWNHEFLRANQWFYTNNRQWLLMRVDQKLVTKNNLPKTDTAPEHRRCPKRKGLLPTTMFKGRAVSLKEGNTWQITGFITIEYTIMIVIV